MTNILVKKAAETNPEYGSYPEKRTIESLLEYGIVNIDKPKGPTTHMVAEYIKQILEIKKCGHSGSLDPAVTGVVVFGLGKATKIVRILLLSPKEYVGIMYLHGDVEEKKIREVMNNFVGRIKQMPPIRSAVRRRLREREIYSFDIIEIDGRNILFKVSCQAGTYIRKLCHDIGKALGVGAHMAELRRTKVANFDERTCFKLHDLKDAYVSWKEKGDESLLRKIIQPVENAVIDIPKIWILDSAVDSICHGAQLHVPGVSKIEDSAKNGDLIAIMTLKNELVALARLIMDPYEIMKNEKGLVAKTERVFMERGVYPRIKRD